MIVNTASSMSGAISRFKFLGDLYKKYNPKGLEIIAMPCNQFNCEKNSLEKIVAMIKNASFKDHASGSMFKVMSFGKVNGPQAHHLYKFLRERAPENNILNHEDGHQIITVDGNFAMFLVGEDGKSVQYLSSKVKLADVESIIAKQLGGAPTEQLADKKSLRRK